MPSWPYGLIRDSWPKRFFDAVVTASCPEAYAVVDLMDAVQHMSGERPDACGPVIEDPERNWLIWRTTSVPAGRNCSPGVESTARSCMEHGFHVTTFTDTTAAFGGRPAYDAMILRYPLMSHATLSVDEFLSAAPSAES
ncbi:hypothetical protein GCM10023335_55020 [Streptomyces siamensis]|uniref:Isochorismatase family protein n=1 Tax=Streptomyces siamensis TaxID=1274986 RepID=A0ABP9J9Q4_9ACTN